MATGRWGEAAGKTMGKCLDASPHLAEHQWHLADRACKPVVRDLSQTQTAVAACAHGLKLLEQT